jgi:hypothetical protein
MDRFLSPVGRPASAMSCHSGSDVRRPVHIPVVTLDEDNEADREIINVPHVYEYIKAFWGPSQTPLTFKCRAKFCNKEIKYSNTSFFNLKRHYKDRHRDEHAQFLAALSDGYSYKKRIRNASAVRYVLVPTVLIVFSRYLFLK